MKNLVFYFLLGLAAASCNNASDSAKSSGDSSANETSANYIEKNLAGYAPVKLTTDISKLTEKERQMIPLLIEAAKIMDDLYWQQCSGNKDSLLNTIKDEKAKQFVE